MKRVMTLCVLVLTLTMALCPAALAADLGSAATAAQVCYPTSISRSEDGTELKKIYDLGPEDDPAGIPRSDFEQDGFHYTLTDLLKQELPENESRQHTETVSLPSKNKDMESVLALLPAEKEFVTDDGLTGILSLDLSTVRVEVAGYGSSTKEVSATRSYPNLAGQDTQYIPKTIEEDGRTLTLQTVNWQTDNTANMDGYAVGDRFTAVATYTGTATSSYVKGYTVTADYTGTVSRIALNKVRYVAIFEGTPLEPILPTEDESTGQLVGHCSPLRYRSPSRCRNRCRSIYEASPRDNGGGERMKRVISTCLTLCLSAALALPASALDYSIDAPGNPDYGDPTSIEVVHTADGGAMKNEDISKNAALIPPSFARASGDAVGTGADLSTNLAPGGMAVGTISGGNMPIVFPPTSGEDTGNTSSGSSGGSSTSGGYTYVTDDLYYSGGYLGTLKISAIGLSVKIYQGTGSSTLAKGAGHFTDTSIWDGTVALAGHNRGVNNHFGKIHTLEIGDKITLTTKLGTRTYKVTSVSKVSETDRSAMTPTGEDRIVLYTCVMNQSAYRWCVQATAV